MIWKSCSVSHGKPEIISAQIEIWSWSGRSNLLIFVSTSSSLSLRYHLFIALRIGSEKLWIEKWKWGTNLGLLTVWKKWSVRYCGSILDILILGIVVCLRISSKRYENLLSSDFLVSLAHQAARLIPVITTSFPPSASTWLISAIISSSGLFLCPPLLKIVRQKLQ